MIPPAPDDGPLRHIDVLSELDVPLCVDAVCYTAVNLQGDDVSRRRAIVFCICYQCSTLTIVSARYFRRRQHGQPKHSVDGVYHGGRGEGRLHMFCTNGCLLQVLYTTCAARCSPAVVRARPKHSLWTSV